MLRLFIVAVFISAASAICDAGPLVLHVTANGADGTLATLQEARDAIRLAKQRGKLLEGAEVHIAGGDYLIDQPLVLTAEDSGTEASPIRYLGDKSNPTRLLAGRIIHRFDPVTNRDVLNRLDSEARLHVRQVDIKKLNITDFGSPGGGGLELFFGGERMPLARWPNEGFVKIVDVANYDGLNVRGTKGSREGRFFYKADRHERWLDESDAWVHGYWFWDWSEQRHAIKAIDPKAKTITVKQPYHNYGYRKGQWYYAYNLLCELDSPGEWWLDRESGVLYFWPPKGSADTEAMVTLLPNLMTLEGVSHTTIQGITLEGTRSTAISVKQGEQVQLLGLTIRNGGGAALSVSGGTNHLVEGCDLYGIGSSGISISGGNRKTLTPAKHRVVNNHIHHYAQVKRVYAAGIHLSGVGNVVANNHIHDAPHMAIGFGGNDHLIELNRIHDVCLESNDAGALYAGRNWTMRGHMIRHNYLHDINGLQNRGSVGVYLDDMFSSATIYGNVFRNVTRAAMIGGGRDCTVENNLFINCTRALHIDGRALSWAHSHADNWLSEQREEGTLSGIAYSQPPYSERYPKLAEILENDPKAPAGNRVVRNLFVGKNWNSIRPEAESYVEFIDNLTDTDPLFVDAAKQDYRLKPESPAHAIGFQPIPFEKIGLFPSPLRASPAQQASTAQ